jgi:hypothetical protein
MNWPGRCGRHEPFLRTTQLPVGCIRGTPESDISKFLPLVETRDGDAFRYPHELKRSSDAPGCLEVVAPPARRPT